MVEKGAWRKRVHGFGTASHHNFGTIGFEGTDSGPYGKHARGSTCNGAHSRLGPVGLGQMIRCAVVVHGLRVKGMDGCRAPYPLHSRALLQGSKHVGRGTHRHTAVSSVTQVSNTAKCLDNGMLSRALRTVVADKIDLEFVCRRIELQNHLEDLLRPENGHHLLRPALGTVKRPERV